MTTSRTAYKLDSSNPGSDLAGETAAALAAASLAFRPYNSSYAQQLVQHAEQVIIGCLICSLIIILITILLMFVQTNNVVNVTNICLCSFSTLRIHLEACMMTQSQMLKNTTHPPAIK